MKKFGLRTLAMALALCLVSAVMPMSAANSEEVAPIYPADVDFRIDGVTVRTALNSSCGLVPSGYSIDYSKCSASTFSATASGIEFRATAGGKITLGVDAPAGNYYVFLNTYAASTSGTRSLLVKVDGQSAGSTNCHSEDGATAGLVRFENMITLENDGEHVVEFVNDSGATGNAWLGSMVLVPADQVYAKFYNPNATTTHTSLTVVAESFKYRENGAVFLNKESSTSKGLAQVKTTTLYFRAKANNKLTFNVWVPESGTYSVKLNASKYYCGGTFDVSIGGKSAGTMDLNDATATKSYVAQDFTEFNDVELTAGINSIVLTCTEVKTSVNEANPGESYNNIQDITLSLKDEDVVEPDPEPTLEPGDINGDGKINTRDVTTLRRYLAGGYEDSITVVAEMVDVNADGRENTRDVAALRAIIAG